MPRRSLAPLAPVLLLAALARTVAAADEPEPQQAQAPAAAREPESQADLLLSQGIELRKAGDDRGALALFERAFALGGSPRALAQRALAEQALGLWREAHEHLTGALARRDDAWIAEHRGTLEAALGEIQAQLGQLEVSCNVDGAEIRLDGRVLGRTPLAGPLRLEAGASVIQIVAPGYFELARQVTIDAGRLSRVNVVLTPSVVPERPAPAPVAPSAIASPAAERPSAAREALLYGSVGLAALGLSVGVTGYALREFNVRTYNDDDVCSQEQGLSRSQECPGEAAWIRRGEITMIAGLSAAGVFGLAGLYFWLDRPAPDVVAGGACAIGVLGVTCHGQF